MRTPLSILLVLPGLAVASPQLDAFDHNVRAGLSPARGQIVVRWDGLGSLADLDAFAAHRGCALHHRWGQRPIATFTCDPAQRPRDLLISWQGAPGVIHAQIPFPVTLERTPSDLTERQWHHRNVGQRIGSVTGTPGADISSVEAWAIGIGSDQPVVAVLDTGVYVDHTELLGRMARNDGEICGNGVDDDGNGYVDDCVGWDFGDDDPDVDPRLLPDRMESGDLCPALHGTFIAGLIAGAADNETGVAGLLWDGRILPLKMAADDDCAIFDTRVAEGVLYAADRGARILNVSWTFGGRSTVLESAFNEAADAGMIFTMAAGNQSRDIDGREIQPIDFALDNQIVVAATENRDRRASFSSWGAEKVDVGAPGWRLWSTGVDAPDAHLSGDGTSYAAPLVAGVAALVWAEWPILRPYEVKRAILDGATPVPSLDCAQTARCVATGARLDAAGAMAEADYWATAPQIERVDLTWVDDEGGDGDGIPERGEQVELVLTLDNQGHGPAQTLDLTVAIDHPYLSPAESQVRLDPIAAYTRAIASPSVPLTIALDCLEDTEATLQLTLHDQDSGSRSTFTRDVLIPCVIDEDDDGSLYPEDCDDHDPLIHPGRAERCNGADDDCDGQTDEDDAVDAVPWFPDLDGDGYGAPGEPHIACQPPAGFGFGDRDCDDTRDDVHPHATEVCDGVDNSCDGQVDVDAIDASTFYEDLDGDGWGGERQVQACEAPRTMTAQPGDCDDRNAQIYPGSPSHDASCQPRRAGWCSAGPGPTSLLALLLALGLTRRRSARPS